MNDGDQYSHLFETTRPAQPALSRLYEGILVRKGVQKRPFCHLPCHLYLNFKARASNQVFMRVQPFQRQTIGQGLQLALFQGDRLGR